MRRAVIVAVAVGAVLWPLVARAQGEMKHRAYLPYLKRDPTPTPDPITCGTWLEDPSLETAWTGDNLGPAETSLFPAEGVFRGLFAGSHWVVATKGRAILLRVDESTSRNGSTAVSFVGDGSMWYGWVLPRVGIGVGTDDGVVTATLDFWYKMNSNSDAPRDSLSVEVLGLPGSNSPGPAIDTRVIDTLPNARADTRNEWTPRSVDLGPYIRGYRTGGRRWDTVGIRFVGNDPDGDSTISRWRIDDIQITACTRESNRPTDHRVDIDLGPHMRDISR